MVSARRLSLIVPTGALPKAAAFVFGASEPVWAWECTKCERIVVDEIKFCGKVGGVVEERVCSGLCADCWPSATRGEQQYEYQKLYRLLTGNQEKQREYIQQYNQQPHVQEKQRQKMADPEKRFEGLRDCAKGRDVH